MKYIIAAIVLLTCNDSFAHVIKNPTDMECLVYSAYRESRGGTVQQVRAVIDVITNRAVTFRETICQVIRKPKQFPYARFGIKKVYDKEFLTLFMNAYTMPSLLPRDYLFFNTKKFKWCGKTSKIDKMYFCKMKEKK